MAVQKHPTWKTYRYDFQYRGRRFSGDTEQTTKREAREVERLKKLEVKAKYRNQPKQDGGSISFKQAADRWHEEVGQHHDNEGTTLTDLEWLEKNIGPNTMLHTLTDDDMAKLIAKRRGEYRWGKKRYGRVSNTTVNRSVTQRLRHIVLRARDIWKVQTPDIAFTDHLLDEPQERVREASIGEESDILSALASGYREAVEFAFDTGCRRMEILGLEWTHVDFFSKRFTVIGKYGKIRTLPMSDRAYELLWAQKEYHPQKVWTYEAQRTLKKRNLIRGERYPQTEAGLKTAFRRAKDRAGVENFRFHDTRHTAATRILRVSNLRVVQDILGHSDPKTTTKYAHAMDDDIRRAYNRAAKKARAR